MQQTTWEDPRLLMALPTAVAVAVMPAVGSMPAQVHPPAQVGPVLTVGPLKLQELADLGGLGIKEESINFASVKLSSGGKKLRPEV